MNLAIGGNYLGNPTTNAINAGSTFPSEMQVDYVRLYTVTDRLTPGRSAGGHQSPADLGTRTLSRFQMQTGSLAAAGAWLPINSNSSPVVITPRNGSVFYRLASP